MVAAGAISPGSHIRADLSPRKDKLMLHSIEEDALAPAC